MCIMKRLRERESKSHREKSERESEKVKEYFFAFVCLRIERIPARETDAHIDEDQRFLLPKLF